MQQLNSIHALSLASIMNHNLLLLENRYLIILLCHQKLNNLIYHRLVIFQDFYKLCLGFMLHNHILKNITLQCLLLVKWLILRNIDVAAKFVLKLQIENKPNFASSLVLSQTLNCIL